jgi:hypothetical protein
VSAQCSYNSKLVFSIALVMSKCFSAQYSSNGEWMLRIALVHGDECLSAQCSSNGELVLSVSLTVRECLSALCSSNGELLLSVALTVSWWLVPCAAQTEGE